MAEKIEVPTGSALEDLRRQRDEKKQFDAESKAKTTKTTMGEGKLKFKKGGAIMKKKLFADGGEVPAEEGISAGLPPFRSKHKAEEDTSAVTGRMFAKRSGYQKSKSGGLPPIKGDFKKGGSIRGGGIESRGKTKGRFV